MRFLTSTQNNYAQDFETTAKESLKRTTSSKRATLTKLKSNCPVSNTFMPLSALSTMSLPLVQTVIEFTNRIPKIMVQFCYLRLYFGIDMFLVVCYNGFRITNGLKLRPTTRYRTYSNQKSTRLIPIR